MFIDGQTVAQRISGQVRRATSELRKYVDAYNAETPENSLPSTVTFEETLDATSNVYLHLHSTLEVGDKPIYQMNHLTAYYLILSK